LRGAHERPKLRGRSLEQILRLLKDGQWHNINEIANITGLSPSKMQLIIEFLAKYNFIQLDHKNARIKISRHTAKFLYTISSITAKKAKSTKAR